MSATESPFFNLDVLSGTRSRAALARIVRVCGRFSASIPRTEDDQVAALAGLITAVGDEIRSGALSPAPDLDSRRNVIRLYKAKLGRGRLKLQLFPLASGESHPPHAHYNLLSCQIVMRGRVRMREYSLLRRLPGNLLEIAPEPEKEIGPGEGVYTLQKRNNIHWQEGLEPNTLLLNINWQGYFADTQAAHGNARHGRRHIDWDNARPAGKAGRIVVPEIVPDRPG